MHTLAHLTDGAKQSLNSPAGSGYATPPVSLNDSQRAAVEHDQGPLLVLAGAGSGKTRVITQRMARLIENGTRPNAILAVTFTNKAAGEMVERMSKLIGKEKAAEVVMGTFHSIGVRFLREEHEALGYNGRFVIFDQSDSMGLVRELMRQERRASAARKLDAGAIQTRISLWKNQFIAPDEIKETDFEYDALARDLYPRYESQLRAMHAVDFDDLVVMPVRILRDREDIRTKWRQRFRYLLIDEFQDTNRSQLELAKLLVNELGNICVVGDDDQSIYAWRGADVGNILEFDKHFPGTKVVKLEENYRSKSAILEIANAAISRGAQRRLGKVLRSFRGAGDKVKHVVLDDVEAEAKFVAQEIKRLEQEGKRLRDIAILYRSNLQAKFIEEALRMNQIGYRLFGGTQVFDRKEVKDAGAYLRVVVNPRDELSLRRILNYPARGIGDTTIERAEKFARTKKKRFGEIALDLTMIDDAPEGAKRGALALREALDTARQSLDRQESVTAVAKTLFEKVGLREEMLRDEDGAKRYSNVEFLLRALNNYENSPNPEKPSLANFLAFITMRAGSENNTEQPDAGTDPSNVVTLSTLHAAKGLEFPVVFLIGCVEGQLPHSRTTDPKVSESAPADVEEERRLFYVGVTRAEDRLYITRPKRRNIRGKVMTLVASRFLEGLPPDEIEEIEHVEQKVMEHEEIEAMAAALLAKLTGG